MQTGAACEKQANAAYKPRQATGKRTFKIEAVPTNNRAASFYRSTAYCAASARPLRGFFHGLFATGLFAHVFLRMSCRERSGNDIIKNGVKTIARL